MDETVLLFSLVLAVSLCLLLWKRSVLDALIEAINNFRGGPPGMHPSPADDSFILLRRRPRKSKSPH